MNERFNDVETRTKTVSSIATDTVTVLRCRWGQARATKKFKPDKTESYQLGKQFDVEPHGVNNLGDVRRVLAELEHDPRRFIIRGELMAGVDPVNVRRMSRGPGAVFIEKARQWVCLDIDSEGEIGDDPREAIKGLLSGVHELRDAACLYQLSSSWALKPGIRAHLWFWLAEPRTNAQLKEWVRRLPIKVDPSLFAVVQPHFVSAPLFDGVIDPAGNALEPRLGLIEGEPTLYIPVGDFEREVAYWEGRIEALGESGDERHPVINKAAYFLGQWAGAGAIDADTLCGRLVEACEQSGAFDAGRLNEAEEELKRAISDGARRPREISDWRNGLLVTDKNVTRLVQKNYETILRNHPAIKGKLAHDVRHDQVVALGRLPWEREPADKYPRPIADHDDSACAGWLNTLGLMTNAVTQISASINLIARETPRDGVREWLEGLPAWGGTKRLDSWLVWSTGCPGDLYHSVVGRKLVISMIARAMAPGIKCDTMVVLQGDQGIKKSTLLRVLSTGPGDWAFCDSDIDPASPKDYIPIISGPWLIEMAELASLGRRQVETNKRFVTSTSDRARLSYGRRVVDIPRKCVFAGSTNDAQFLQDMTGNRRYYPIRCPGDINIEGLIGIREQLFAEALAAWRGGEGLWVGEEVERIARGVQEQARAVDPMEDLIRDYLDEPELGGEKRTEVTFSEVCLNAIGRSAGDITGGRATQIGRVLRMCGWTKKRLRRNEKLQWIYVRDGDR